MACSLLTVILILVDNLKPTKQIREHDPDCHYMRYICRTLPIH